jgi:hypothetical protein
LAEAQPTQHFVPAVSYASSRTLKHLLTCPVQATISLHISLSTPAYLARAIGALPLLSLCYCADLADGPGTCSPPKASNPPNLAPVSFSDLGGVGGSGELDEEHFAPPMISTS